jgi:hypothetical protein
MDSETEDRVISPMADDPDGSADVLVRLQGASGASAQEEQDEEDGHGNTEEPQENPAHFAFRLFRLN